MLPTILKRALPALFLLALPLAAADSPGNLRVDTGDTAWVLISSALVLFMTAPALALFYGGLVRRKNVLSVIMQCIIAIAAVSAIWAIFGYSMAFSPKALIPGFLGNLDWTLLKGVGMAPSPDYASTIPHLAFMLFQCMFAVITPALIIGAFAERMRFSAYLVFTVLWTVIVYIPVTHWLWSTDGWLYQLGAVDFAGGIVVHVNAGMAALAAAVFIGNRRHTKAYPPHDLTYTALGAAMLWFGWFGFNGGSALGANGLAVNAIVVSHLAACAATLLWVALDWIVLRRPTLLGSATGAIAGLAAITPAAGYVGPASAMLIGLISSGLCYLMVMVVKPRLNYDDALDAFGVHGVGGLWGSLAVGLFASPAIQPKYAGLFYGGGGLLLRNQFIAVAVCTIWAFALTFLILFIIEKAMGLRISQTGEAAGLDVTEHHERAYTIIE